MLLPFDRERSHTHSSSRRSPSRQQLAEEQINQSEKEYCLVLVSDFVTWESFV